MEEVKPSEVQQPEITTQTAVAEPAAVLSVPIEEPLPAEDGTLGKRSRRDITPAEVLEQEAVELVVAALESSQQQRAAQEVQSLGQDGGAGGSTQLEDEQQESAAGQRAGECSESVATEGVTTTGELLLAGTADEIEPEHEPASDSYKKFRKEAAPELTLSEPVFDYPIAITDSNGWVKKLISPPTSETAGEQNTKEPLQEPLGEQSPDNEETKSNCNPIQWDQVKNVSIKLDGYDRKGARLQWIKSYWPNPNLVKKVRKDWKYFCEGIKIAFELLQVGESAWFTLDEPAQKIPFVVGFPTEPEPVCIKIELVSVDYKQKSGPKDQNSPEPVQTKAYDLDSNFEKITILKIEADRNYHLLKCYETSLNDYTELHQKLTGLISQLKRTTDKPLWTTDAETLHLNVMNNLVLMNLKLEQPEIANEWVDKVLRLQPLNQKANFRKGKILEQQNSLEDALTYYKQAGAQDDITRVVERLRLRKAAFARKYSESLQENSGIVEGRFSSSSSHLGTDSKPSQIQEEPRPLESTSSARSLAKELESAQAVAQPEHPELQVSSSNKQPEADSSALASTIVSPIEDKKSEVAGLSELAAVTTPTADPTSVIEEEPANAASEPAAIQGNPEESRPELTNPVE